MICPCHCIGSIAGEASPPGNGMLASGLMGGMLPFGAAMTATAHDRYGDFDGWGIHLWHGLPEAVARSQATAALYTSACAVSTPYGKYGSKC